jgi:hypothetical protein
MGNKTHGESLEPKMRAFDAKLSQSKFDPELFKIIHFPGFTTLPEVFLIEKNIEILDGLADLIQFQKASLLVAGRQIASGVEATV